MTDVGVLTLPSGVLLFPIDTMQHLRKGPRETKQPQPRTRDGSRRPNRMRLWGVGPMEVTSFGWMEVDSHAICLLLIHLSI